MNLILNIILAQATDGVKLGEEFGSRWGQAIYQNYRLANLASLFMNVSFVLAGIIVVVLTILAGFNIVANAGNPDALEKGQKQLTYAIAGLIVVAFAYWGIRIIEIVLGARFFTNPLTY